MMKTLRILYISLALAITTLFGCTTVSSYTSTNDVITQYTSQYIEISSVDTNTDNHDIAAMLQTITVGFIRLPSESLEEIEKREDQYISIMTTGVISKTYTIMASSNEISIVDGFCDDIIKYYSTIEPNYPEFFGDFLGDVSIRFIVNMDNYEYDKIKNNR
jgi:hypothetical protein